MAMMMDPYGMMVPRERHHSKKQKEAWSSLKRWLHLSRSGEGKREEEEEGGATLLKFKMELERENDQLLEESPHGLVGSA